LDRRTNGPDGPGGASPTAVTSRQGGGDLITDDQDTRPTGVMAASAVRPRTPPAAASAPEAKDTPANGGPAAADKGKGSPAADNGKDSLGGAVTEAIAGEGVPALPADTIGLPGSSSAFPFTRPLAAPVPPGPDDWVLPGSDEWTMADSGKPSPGGSPAAEAAAPAKPDARPLADRAPSGAEPPAADPARIPPSGAGTPKTEPSTPAVSAAAFAWETPHPLPTSPSSPARSFLRSTGSPEASATQASPAASVGPGTTTVGQSAARPRSAPRKASAKRSSRQAHLTIARVEPWSVMKFSFVVSVAAFVILFVAVAVLYGSLSALGVFESLEKVVSNVTSSQSSAGVNASRWFSASRVLGYTALLGSLNIVLITAMSTIGAVVYNLSSRLVGGVEVTLRETE
jgi:Transmembrane domain of unknown function (DUF3566)